MAIGASKSGCSRRCIRNCAVSRICQVDLADTYEHKHQVLSEDDASKGLRRMATDIAKSLFRTMAAEGLVFTADHFRSLEVRYVRMAQDTIARYYADAMLNGLKFDRHAEETAVATFAQSLRQAAADFVEDPLGLPLIPNWNRVLAAIPEFFDLLQDAVEKDNRQAGCARRVTTGMAAANLPGEALRACRNDPAGRYRHRHPELQQCADHRATSRRPRAPGWRSTFLSSPERHHQLRRRVHRRHAPRQCFRRAGRCAPAAGLDAALRRAPAVVPLPRHPGQGQRVPADLPNGGHGFRPRPAPWWIPICGRSPRNGSICLLRPILMADFDFVAPYYHRHKYDGTITNSIVYPLTRALYGLRVRQPIGGEFGISKRLVARYLERDDWETDVARYGIDIWMTTIAIAEGYRVCQSFLGAKLHDAKDPGSDLSAMLHQVVGSVFLADAGVPGSSG